MAKDEYLEIDDLDTTSEEDRVSMAMIYMTALFSLGTFLLLQLKMAEYGIGLFK